MRSLRTYIAAVFLILSALSARAGILPEPQTWSFMQTVGGIGIGDPYQEDGAWYLPVSCDVSGQTMVTVAPTRLNSTLAAADVNVNIKGSEIFLTVVTIMKSHNKSSLCGPAILGNPPAGKYSVLYRDPDGTTRELGRISIKK